MNELESVREEFTELWGQLGRFWGLPPTTAQVYAWLLSSDEELDADTLMEELSLSRGAISMAVRELRDWGLVHVEPTAGSRRLTYRVESDPERTIRAIVATRKRREWDPVLENVRDFRDRLEGEDSPTATTFRERLAVIESLVSVTDAMAERLLSGGVVKSLAIELLVRRARKKTQPRRKA